MTLLDKIVVALGIFALSMLVTLASCEAAKKKETKKKEAPAAKVEQSEPIAVKVWPDYEQLPNACAGINWPVLLRGEKRLVPVKCCPEIDLEKKVEETPWICELVDWNKPKDQSQLPKAVAPPKG